MAIDYDLTEGDIGTTIDLTCLDQDAVAINIATASPIRYRWKQQGKSQVFKSASVQDGPNGVARYTTLSEDVLKGDLQIQVEITIAGSTWTSDVVEFTVGSLLS